MTRVTAKSRTIRRFPVVPTLLAAVVLVLFLIPDLARVPWARMCLACGCYDQALSVLKSAEVTPGVMLLQARARFHKRDFADSVRLFYDVGPETAGDLGMLGQGLAALGKWSEAVTVLQLAFQKGLDAPDAQVMFIELLTFLGRYDEASESAVQLQKNPEYAVSALFTQGSIELDRGHYDRFIELRQLLLAIPDAAGRIPAGIQDVKSQLAEVCVDRGQFPVAGRLLTELEETSKHCFLRGEVLSDAGDVAGAVQAWRRSIELEPGAVGPRSRIARHLFGEGDAQAALEILQPIAAKKDLLPGDVCQLLRQICTVLGQTEAAAEWKIHSETVQQRTERFQKLSSLASGSGSESAPYISDVIRAWKLASSGFWYQAEEMIRPLELGIPVSARQTHVAEYVRRLAEAIRYQRDLPDPMELVDPEPDLMAVEHPSAGEAALP